MAYLQTSLKEMFQVREAIDNISFNIDKTRDVKMTLQELPTSEMHLETRSHKRSYENEPMLNNQ